MNDPATKKNFFCSFPNIYNSYCCDKIKHKIIATHWKDYIFSRDWLSSVLHIGPTLFKLRFEAHFRTSLTNTMNLSVSIFGKAQNITDIE